MKKIIENIRELVSVIKGGASVPLKKLFKWLIFIMVMEILVLIFAKPLFEGIKKKVFSCDSFFYNYYKYCFT